MTDLKPALVLHLAAGGEPIMFPLTPDDAEELGKKLRLLVEHGSVESIQTSEGATVVINFAQLAAAYIDDLQRKNKVFGLR